MCVCVPSTSGVTQRTSGAMQIRKRKFLSNLDIESKLHIA